MRRDLATAARIVLLLACAPPLLCTAQGPVPAGPSTGGREGSAAPLDAAADQKPLPDIVALMFQVEEKQRQSEAIAKTYLFRSVVTQQELDAHGQVKKTTTTEADHFWLNGVPVNRLVRRNGKDLTPAELAKEDERLEKEARKDRERRDKNQAAGKETDAQGHEEFTLSRFLALGTFTNPRRVELGGRPAIAVDYTGDPHARTRNRAEEAVREMAGTVWVDEQDAALARVEGRFVRAFKIGGGLIADVKKDTSFAFQQTKINGEIWLPAHLQAQGAIRALILFSFSGHVEVVDSEYRKFRATATILPEVTPVGPEGTPAPAGSSKH